MARSKRRKSGSVPFVLPVHSDWRPRVGDSVDTFSPAGDPRNRSTSLESAYVLPQQNSVGPLLLSNFIGVASLTVEQCNALQETLGIPITKAAREEIDAAIHKTVTTIALSTRIPGWGAFRKRLRAIIKSGQTCTEAARQFVEMTNPSTLGNDRPKGALSVDQAVKIYLLLAGANKSIVNIDIDALVAACQRGLEEVEPRASKRGTKSNIALDRFLHAVEIAAQLLGAPTALPSNKIREKGELPFTTPFFRFGRECLKIAITNGKAAITAASLADGERSRAEEIFSHLEKYITGDRKSDGSFLSRWRDARANLKNNRGSN